jgi:protein-disulfide isomerase
VDAARGRLPALEVVERNLVQHPELGPRYGVVATPAIVINGRLEFSGVPRARALLDRLEAILAREGK